MSWTISMGWINLVTKTKLFSIWNKKLRWNMARLAESVKPYHTANVEINKKRKVVIAFSLFACARTHTTKPVWKSHTPSSNKHDHQTIDLVNNFRHVHSSGDWCTFFWRAIEQQHQLFRSPFRIRTCAKMERCKVIHWNCYNQNDCCFLWYSICLWHKPCVCPKNPMQSLCIFALRFTWTSEIRCTKW